MKVLDASLFFAAAAESAEQPIVESTPGIYGFLVYVKNFSITTV